MPQQVLRGLGLVAVVFAVYSLYNFYFFTSSWRPRLAAIAMANVVYGAVALRLVLYYRASVSGWGVAYFVMEAAIVGVLVTVELRTSLADATALPEN